MIKQQQRVIKKGDYYQMQTYQETMMLISKTKKQQQSTNNTNNQPTSEYIITDLPSWINARDKYYCNTYTQIYQSKGANQLIDQLNQMNKQDTLNDQDRKQIEKLIQEIDSFANSKQLLLNQLPIKKQSPATSAKQAQNTTINLTAKYNIQNISQRIDNLSSLDFPDLISLEHQLQIMLGQKKPLQSLQLSVMDQKQKQELNNLYNHLNSLSIMNNTQRVIESVTMEEGKHVEMLGWVQKVEKVQGVNADFLIELKKDEQIVNRLQKIFGENIKQVRQILGELKKVK